MSWSFILAAAAAGAVSLLTPCVFPMVPITVSYFTANRTQDSRKALRGALAFGLGIILTFTALGLLCAILAGATGIARFAANPWVNLGLTVVFVVFAMSLFGVFEITIPSSVLTAMDRAAREREGMSVVGPVLMGLTFTLTSFTCTAPFIGTVLLSAAKGQWLMPAVGMLVYSTVFALPFVLLAMAPHALGQLPKAGPWLARVKMIMGLAELAAATKFLANVDLVWHWGIFTRQVVLLSWVALALAAVWIIIGLGITPVRTAVASAFLVLAVWLGFGARGRPLGELDAFLPLAPNAELAWHKDDLASALKVAQQEHRRVFIDFTGYTCTNCRWMEANVFARPEVKAQLAQFVLARLYTDDESSVDNHQQTLEQTQFGTVALPLYAIVNPDGTTFATSPGVTRNPLDFQKFLSQGL